jgi:hypothetical protein
MNKILVSITFDFGIEFEEKEILWSMDGAADLRKF